MKKILSIALLLIIGSGAYSQSNKPIHAKTAPALKTAAKKHAHTAAAPAAAGTAASYDSAGYVGTNEFNLALVREGIRRA